MLRRRERRGEEEGGEGRREDQPARLARQSGKGHPRSVLCMVSRGQRGQEEARTESQQLGCVQYVFFRQPVAHAVVQTEDRRRSHLRESSETGCRRRRATPAGQGIGRSLDISTTEPPESWEPSLAAARAPAREWRWPKKGRRKGGRSLVDSRAEGDDAPQRASTTRARGRSELLREPA